jgi:hypothetical protein
MADLTTESQAAPATTASTTATPVAAPETQTAAAATTPAAEATTTTPAAVAETTETKAPVEGEAPKEGDKPPEEAKPVEYELKVPEGVKLEGESLDALKAFAKERGLSQADAQALTDMGVKQAQAFQAQLVEHGKQVAEQWTTATKTDKEFGGDKLGENLAIAKQALDTFGSKELKTLLNDSGLGNHPEIIRAFYRAGKAISEDRRLVTGAAAQKNRDDTPVANRLYPNQK